MRKFREAVGKVVEETSPFDILDEVIKKMAVIFDARRLDMLAGIEGASLKPNETIPELAGKIQLVCSMDTDCALGYIMMEGIEQYSIRHSLHTAIICEIVSKYLGWPAKERIVLLSAALTMNVSIMLLQDKLFYQEEPLNPTQKDEIRGHPEKGIRMLANAGIKNKIWLESVLQHHETPDGNGYPQRLKDSGISLSARLISLSDIFCARISGRDYRKPLLPNEALKAIFLSGGSSVETDLGMMFIKIIGIYPPGTVVRLCNGEIAIVSHRGSKANQPVIQSLMMPNGNAMRTPTLRDCSNKEFAITEVIPYKEADLNFNRFQIWGYGIYKKAKPESRDTTDKIRSERRIVTNLSAAIQRPNDMTPYKGIINNLSSSGCQIKLPPTPIEFMTDDEHKISFKVPDLTTEGLIRQQRCLIRSNRDIKTHRLLGIQFIDIHERSKQMIDNYLEQLKRIQA